MPTNTPNLSIPKPLGTENFTRANFNTILDQIDSSVGTHMNDTSHVRYGVATGSANTYAITLTPAPTSYVDGMAVTVKINVQNTGASTINVNGLGAKTIKKTNGNDVGSGNLKASTPYTLRYNGTNFILQGEGASGNAIASDLLSGKTAGSDAGDLVGTMTNNGAVTITPNATNQTIPAGYHNGSGVVNGDADLIAANIKSGVNIFGINGTLDIASLGGKRVASGTATSSSGSFGLDYTYNGNSVSANMSTLQVSGLSFTPSKIIIYATSAASMAVYWDTMDASNSGNIQNVFVSQSTSQVYFGGIGANPTYFTSFYVRNGAFSMPVNNNSSPYNWIAYE